MNGSNLASRFLKPVAALCCLFVLFSAFASGYVAGHKNVGQPRTVIHAVSIQWKQGVSQGDKDRVLAGVKEMAQATPGVINIWIKSERVEPRGFDDGFAIEFKDRAAADAYVLGEPHQNWNEIYLPLRSASISIDVSNP